MHSSRMPSEETISGVRLGDRRYGVTDCTAGFGLEEVMCFLVDHVSLLGRMRRFRPPSLAPPGKALIAQNKGGGHGELGYHLALKLMEKDISVTLLQDGAGKNRDKQPFARYCGRASLTCCVFRPFGASERYYYCPFSFPPQISAHFDISSLGCNWKLSSDFVSYGRIWEDHRIILAISKRRPEMVAKIRL